MKTRFLVTLFTTLCLLTSAYGQQNTPNDSNKEKPQQSSVQKDTEGVVRISVTLVQVDVAVTDKKGRPVTDLKPGDFEIYESGRRQQITNFSHVSPEPTEASAPSAGASKTTERYLPPPPPRNLRPSQVRRTIALVVDDLTLTVESAPFVRQALKKFVTSRCSPATS
jgi:VWFA-related protein